MEQDIPQWKKREKNAILNEGMNTAQGETKRASGEMREYRAIYEFENVRLEFMNDEVTQWKAGNTTDQSSPTQNWRTKIGR